MSSHSYAFRAILLIGGVFGICGQSAHASLFFGPVPSSVYQAGLGALVRHGLTVQARTEMPRLTAGGSFTAWCMSEHTNTFTGERELSSALTGRPNVLYVTIPEMLPAYQNMPGFENVERGRSITCYFDWKAYAEESTFQIGLGGTTVAIAGEKQRTSGRETFVMDKPGRSTGDDDACIP